MAVSATLVYTVSAVGPVSPNQLFLAMGAVPLGTADLVNTGMMTLTSDTTTGPVLQVSTRTIVFALNANFNAAFPANSDQAAMFRDVFTHQLAGALKSRVTAAAPVIA